MTTDGAGPGGPSGLEVPPGAPGATGPGLDGYGLPPASSRTYLLAIGCLIGGIVSVVVAIACVAAYVNHGRSAGELAFLGQAIGLLAGIGGMVGANKHPGGVNLIYKAAGWTGTIVFIALLSIYGSKHGWSS